MKEILVLFKTHLDVGFTNLAANVVDNYLNAYIPKAMEVAKAMRGKDERFVWTVGSWMIREYLRRGGDPAAMEDAIAHGDIRWHGLPFTTHTELMNVPLFEHGAAISKQLDQRFGMTTRAAKMTDVPGHTRSMVPLLAKAGIRFLHIGVNPASTVPGVPPLFVWRAPTGEEIVVMYQSNYGEFTEIGNSGIALYFAHTGDNHGPQSVEQIESIYAGLHEKFPDVRLRAATLEDVADVALSLGALPVVTSEIGDTWIHGVGCDPKKVSGYRAMLRLAETLPEAEREAVYDALLPVPEHTWGLDEKSFLNPGSEGEHRYFVRTEFEAMRSTAPFQLMESSWQEQRNYVKSAAEVLSGPARARAEQAFAEASCPAFDPAGYEQLDPAQPVQLGSFTVTVGENGALTSLMKGEQQLAARPWGEILYQALSQHELDRFREQYVTSDADWAIEDFGKIGCDAAISEELRAEPVLEALYCKGNELVCLLRMEGDCFEKYGAPGKLALCWTFGEQEILLDLRWWNKPATRVPEGLWVTFCPPRAVTGLHKLGQWVDPLDVVVGGNRRLHAVDTGVRCGGCVIETLDTALAGVGGPSLLDFHRDQPDTEAGVWFNLHNNTWGTNFVMWYDEDARFRFRIVLPEQE